MMETLNALKAGKLKGIKRLNLAAGLTQFPVEIFDLADSLEILDLTHNQLKSLPNEFRYLQKLRIVFLSSNEFEELPPVLSQCPNLSMVGFKSNRITSIAEDALPDSIRWLILTDNQIEKLPISIGRLTKLQKLMLAGNQLRSLPDEMAHCQSLELIRLSANQLTTLPSWLFTLPRLSWLAFSGNPICNLPIVARSLPTIDWADLTLEDCLGQGASGIIFKGSWRTKTETIDVAVKLFKGTVTSDGLPVDEMRSCIAAGTHPNLVKLLGQIINHPEQKAGLVFAFISPSYKNLGLPPSLDTCTRDTYSPDTTFSLPVILHIVKGIAAATAHLHFNSILHGDLYAHNILVNDQGDCLLGDFGAASFYPAHPVISRSLQLIEVRAFGCLLEELLDRCKLNSTNADSSVYDRLRQLQLECLNSILSERPSFNKICDMLATI